MTSTIIQRKKKLLCNVEKWVKQPSVSDSGQTDWPTGEKKQGSKILQGFQYHKKVENHWFTATIMTYKHIHGGLRMQPAIYFIMYLIQKKFFMQR